MKIELGCLVALSLALSVSVASAVQGITLDRPAGTQKMPQSGNEATRLLFHEIVGPTEPVLELDLAELLVQRATEADRLGLIKKEQKRMRERLRSHVREPVSLEVPRATTKTTWSFELLRKEDLSQLSEAAAEAISTQSRAYAFFDATDVKQSQWAIGLQKTQQGRPFAWLLSPATERHLKNEPD